MSDLQSWVSQVLARKSRKIEPLPEIKPYEVYAYASKAARDPFESFVKDEPERPEEQVQITSGIHPDFDRNREELEAFPLDSLRMVGTVEKDQDIWGIILASEGTIYRIQVGNYMGRNHGKISNIQEDRVELTEIIPDGLGGWQERQASLALVE
jgi:type IV pilus assembly protein PilP